MFSKTYCITRLYTKHITGPHRRSGRIQVASKRVVAHSTLTDQWYLAWNLDYEVSFAPSMVVNESAIAAFTTRCTYPTCARSKLQEPGRRLSNSPVQRKQKKKARCVVHNTSVRAACWQGCFCTLVLLRRRRWRRDQPGWLAGWLGGPR